jgi:hypothetical protein
METSTFSVASTKVAEYRVFLLFWSLDRVGSVEDVWVAITRATTFERSHLRRKIGKWHRYFDGSSSPRTCSPGNYFSRLMFFSNEDGNLRKCAKGRETDENRSGG